MQRTREVVVDIETDNLIIRHNATFPTVVHCIVAKDVNSNEIFKFYGETLHDFKEFAESVKTFIGHNIIMYDAPVLRRLLGVVFPEHSLCDTLVLSRLHSPHLTGGHSLDAWGQRFKLPKISFNDFSKFSDEMLKYCVQDVEINARLYKWLRTKGVAGFSSFSIKLENEVNEVIEGISTNGAPVDIERVYVLLDKAKAEYARLEESFKHAFPPERILKGYKTPRYTAMGEMYANDEAMIKRHEHELMDDGRYALYAYREFNPLSPVQALEKLEGSGWKPYLRTKAGNNWRVCEENLETLPEDAAQELKDLAIFRILKSRIDAILGWIKAYNPETKCVHPRIICPGAATQRMSHTQPQTGNIPAGRSYLGKDMRECFRSSDPNYKYVGMDLDSIQLCVLAHYMNDETYINALNLGNKQDETDIHNVNMRLAGLADRDLAKKFIYSLILNASNTRLAEDQGFSVKEAAAARNKLMSAIPAFATVDRYCDRVASQGFHICLDGRRVAIPNKHKALATILQSEESIVMRIVLCLINREIKARGLDARICLIVHDEVQAYVHIDAIEEYSQIALDAVTKAGELLKYRCVLKGEVKVGDSWYETH